ncbi:hypothetical protein ACKVMT_08065 [Halobacteriales archaeon Cl-PHB]
MDSDSELTDKGRLLFGAGFVFGVAVTMLVMAVVTATVAGRTGRGGLASEIVVTIAAGVFFASVVGVSLYLLAFPENRVEVPIGGLADHLPGVEAEKTSASDDHDDR